MSEGSKIIHVVNLDTMKFYHCDDLNRLWTCDCLIPVNERISLCISICDHLKAEGNLRDIERKIAIKRKRLGLLINER